MADHRSRIDAGLGLSPGSAGPAVTTVEIAAAAASLLWLVAAGGWLLFSGDGDGATALRGVVVLVALVLPVAMIWVAATAWAGGLPPLPDNVTALGARRGRG